MGIKFSYRTYHFRNKHNIRLLNQNVILDFMDAFFSIFLCYLKMSITGIKPKHMGQVSATMYYQSIYSGL